MKGEPDRVLKDLAGFMGYGFSKEEEANDIVGDILRLCSFENLSNLEINPDHQNIAFIDNNKVNNFLQFDMVEQPDVIIQEKLGKHGLNL
ncbi:hypothetical protein K1719_022803 [Acacia pycnantha]|nr:hypothetical protein K1719_022803 [Acacia pycnantha]